MSGLVTLRTARFHQLVGVLPRLPSFQIARVVDVEFTLRVAADAAGKVVPLKNLKPFFLPSWVA